MRCYRAVSQDTCISEMVIPMLTYWLKSVASYTVPNGPRLPDRVWRRWPWSYFRNSSPATTSW